MKLTLKALISYNTIHKMVSEKLPDHKIGLHKNAVGSAIYILVRRSAEVETWLEVYEKRTW